VGLKGLGGMGAEPPYFRFQISDFRFPGVKGGFAPLKIIMGGRAGFPYNFHEPFIKHPSSIFMINPEITICYPFHPPSPFLFKN
jgi:hypothetical protein